MRGGRHGVGSLWEAANGGLIVVERELLLFALVGLALGGLDDFLMDCLFLARKARRDLFVYRRHPRMTAATLPPSDAPGPIALFVPAWREANVIGAMLRGCSAAWPTDAVRLFVGTYPNDPDTIRAVAAVAAAEPRLRLVILPHDGGTTKADCLNHIWAAMRREEKATGRRFKAVVLHDAEDVVHPDEIRLFDRMIDRFAMVQLPVRPLLSPRSRWIAGHYADEFAEAHGKTLALREAVGAAVPSAGVGCAFAREALDAIARARGGAPFDPASLTEDYEIGLRIAERGGRTAFVAMTDADGEWIATQEHFPETLDAAVRQKARWFVGIALAGWDRLGWHGSLRERWMRLHDRRAILSALVLFVAYLATLGYGLSLAVALSGGRGLPPPSPALAALMAWTGFLMAWRLLLRALWTGRRYGWREGVRAVPRTVVGNIIAMMAARRAVGLYWRQLRGGGVVWEKTHHRFPAPGATGGRPARAAKGRS